MKERSDEGTPMVIKRWLMFPYLYFSHLYGGKDISMIDIACGPAFQKDVLHLHFGKVMLADAQPVSSDILEFDVTNINLPNKSVDIVFSFETIEHTTKHAEVIFELARIARKMVVIGSVNIDGPCEVGGLEIYTRERNPFHVKELGMIDFAKLHPTIKTLHSVFENDRFEMKSGLSVKGISNYGVIKL